MLLIGKTGCRVYGVQLSSVIVISDSLRPHGLQHARLPCPSPSPRVCSDSCPSSQWCHSTISSSVIPFSSCLQAFPASGSFPKTWLHIRWLTYWSFSISPSSEYSGLISFRIEFRFNLLAVQGTLKSLLQHHSSKASILWRSAFFTVQGTLDLGKERKQQGESSVYACLALNWGFISIPWNAQIFSVQLCHFWRKGWKWRSKSLLEQQDGGSWEEVRVLLTHTHAHQGCSELKLVP